MASLTDQAQQLLQAKLSPGDIAIDATAGNGHDTLFLAQQVGSSGRVFAFDIQQLAIDETRQRLEKHNMLARVDLLKESHAYLSRHIPAELHQKISLIMFNLGYLPGSDKSCITMTETTLSALTQAMQLLRPDGLLSIMLYPGHTGGDRETKAVLEWADQLPAGCKQQHLVTRGPQWLLLQHID